MILENCAQNIKSDKNIVKEVLRMKTKNGSTTDKTNNEDNEEQKPQASSAEIVLIVLILMFILMLLSEWTDLSFLFQTSRHQMVIIET